MPIQEGCKLDACGKQELVLPKKNGYAVSHTPGSLSPFFFFQCTTMFGATRPKIVASLLPPAYTLRQLELNQGVELSPQQYPCRAQSFPRQARAILFENRCVLELLCSHNATWRKRGGKAMLFAAVLPRIDATFFVAQ